MFCQGHIASETGRAPRPAGWLHWLAAAALLVLPGCMMGPNYQRPTVDSPGEFRAPPPTTAPDSPTAPPQPPTPGMPVLPITSVVIPAVPGIAPALNVSPAPMTPAAYPTPPPTNSPAPAAPTVSPAPAAPAEPIAPVAAPTPPGMSATPATTTGTVTPTSAEATTSTSPAALADLAWWQIYQDPVLQQLLHEALTNNYDVRIAAQDVVQAQQLVLEQQSALYPQVGYSGGVSRGRNQYLGQLQAQNGAYSSTTSAQVGLSWEIDLWGRLRRADEAARAEYLSTVEAQRGVWLSLVSDVASTYFELLGLDAQLQVAKGATQTYTETLNLFEDRLKGGVASLLDTSSAAGALGAASAQIPDIERQITETENQLCVLLGRNPGPIPRGLGLTAQTFPPNIPAGLPSQLLERRPDILKAEQEIRAANARIGVAKANFFPQLSLTGALGKASPEMSAFTGGGANAWSIAASLAGPIFEGGLLRAQYKGAYAAWQQSELEYQSTVLNAFEEVSDALTDEQKLAQVRVRQEYSVNSYSQAVDVSMKRYIAGKASYYEVLDAQTKLFPNEADLVNTRVAELQAVVDLYKALGGGWSLKEQEFLQGSMAAPDKAALAKAAKAAAPTVSSADAAKVTSPVAVYPATGSGSAQPPTP
jgi:outer membrane protein, multidrug efflux system